MFSSLKPAMLDALSSSRWWRQQGWLVTTEVLMGFLAAWGLSQGVAAAHLALGLALVYLMPGLGMNLAQSQGYRAGILLLATGLASSVITSLSAGGVSWYALCMASGTLLFFRDQQTANMLAWMPVRSRRAGIENSTALRATTVLSGTLLAASLFTAGFLIQHWPWLPLAMVLVALVILVPRQLKTMGPARHALAARPAPHWNPSHYDTLSWLLKLAMAFNSVNFLGRRLLLPVALLTMVSHMGWGENSLPILGGALAVMGLIGVLLRPPAALSQRLGPYGLLRWGARLTLGGWALLTIGFAVWSWWDAWLALPVMLIGWALLELTNRSWAVSYVNCLHLSTAGPRRLATRAHRHSLSQFMIHKASGASAGLGAASLVPATHLPILVLGLVALAFFAIETAPEDPRPSPALE